MTMQDNGGDTALIRACESGYVESARTLIDHGASIEHQNNVSIINTVEYYNHA